MIPPYFRVAWLNHQAKMMELVTAQKQAVNQQRQHPRDFKLYFVKMFRILMIFLGINV